MAHVDDRRLSIAQCVWLACLMEVSAPKPGNVYRGADFDDLTYPDFLVAATAIAPILERAPQKRLGETVLAAVVATRSAVGTNVNLGMILLTGPLAMVPREEELASGVREVLARLTPEDSRDVYEAIRLARPGGLGSAAEADVHGAAPANLVAAMRLAADRDMVARQYAENFHHVLKVIVPSLTEALRVGKTVSEAIVHVHVRFMANNPDSLIGRKCGPAIAEEAAARAQSALAAAEVSEEAYWEAVGDLDFWLRADGHRRNPGTTADLIAAGLFAALRDDIIKAPFRLA